MPDQVGHDGHGWSGMTVGQVGRDGAVNRAGRAGRVYTKAAFGRLLGVNAEGGWRFSAKGVPRLHVEGHVGRFFFFFFRQTTRDARSGRA